MHSVEDIEVIENNGGMMYCVITPSLMDYLDDYILLPLGKVGNDIYEKFTLKMKGRKLRRKIKRKLKRR